MNIAKFLRTVFLTDVAASEPTKTTATATTEFACQLLIFHKMRKMLFI